mgnify:CR=1 FL=1
MRAVVKIWIDKSRKESVNNGQRTEIRWKDGMTGGRGW